MQSLEEDVFRAHKKHYCTQLCKMYKTKRDTCKKIRKIKCYPNMWKTVNNLLNKFKITRKDV